MAHHHKSNRAVEGDPDTGHSRGLPERPDADRLQTHTEADRRAVADAEPPSAEQAAADGDIAAWTRRLRSEAPALPPEQAQNFVHDLYFGAQRALDRKVWEADFERDE
ncbi:hypothetical protein [Streptomyces sp. NPDC021224]|uniref:hypothetical protein n=1 Tax=unclassified Streptomyces TaxID=2593676 RepID=UPI0037879507